METILDFLKFFLPLGGAAFAWYWNERGKRTNDLYIRKEQKYVNLVESLEGFYAHVAGQERGRELKSRFLAELNKCWLYCPDDVIQKAYDFLEKVHEGAKYSDEIKENAVGELMLAIRTDLLVGRPFRKTMLSASDFRHLKVNSE